MNALQAGLFNQAPKPATLEERFLLWAVAHEKVILMFLDFARRARSNGKRKIGIGLLAERVRWEIYYEKGEAEEFKINNSYRSRLARHLIKIDPSLEGLFELRKLKTK